MTRRSSCNADAARLGRTPGFAPAILLAMLASLTAIGCDRAARPAAAPAPPEEADRILREMIAAYRQTPSYADRAVVRLRYRLDDRWAQDEGKLNVRFQRPNRLLVRAYQLTLTSDGSRCQAIIADAATGNLDGQIAVTPAPDRLTLEQIYRDPLVMNVMASGMGGPPVTLELLLNEEPIAELLGEQAARELLSEGVIEDRSCDRVKITLPEGRLVLWIDRQSRVLRRMEYPTEQLAAQLDPSGRIRDVTLVAEMHQAAFEVDLSGDAFRFDLPDEAKLVQRFVVPPPPPPSELYGQRPDKFQFTDLDGGLVTQQDLLGRPTVLVWFNIHPASEACLRQLSQLDPPLVGDIRFACYIVCTEPAETSNRQLQQVCRRWGLSWPVLRDLQAVGRDVFQIPAAPTVVVLDAQGLVQGFEVGAGSAIVATLPQMLCELLRGEDLAGPLLLEFRQQQEQYERSLSEVLQ